MEEGGLHEFHNVDISAIIENEHQARGIRAFQGELLKLYLLVYRPPSTPPPLGAATEELTVFHEQEAARAAEFKARWTGHCSHLQVDVQLLKEDEKTVGVKDKDSYPRPSELRSALFRRRTGSLSVAENAPVQRLQTEGRSTPSSKSSVANQGETSAPSVVSDFNEEGVKQPDVVFLVEVPVSVKPEFLGMELILEVSITASVLALSGIRVFSDVLSKGFSGGKDEGHERALSRLYNLSRNTTATVAPRKLRKTIVVVQPVSIRAHHTYLSGTTCVCIQVENVQTGLPLQLHDIQFHLNSTRRNSIRTRLVSSEPSMPLTPTSPSTAIREEAERIADLDLDIGSLFKAYIKQENFPIELLPGEQHNFILCIEEQSYTGQNLVAPDSDRPARRITPVGSFRSLLTVTWKNECMASYVIAQNTLKWSRPGPAVGGISLSLSGESPVVAKKVFSVSVNVVNRSPEPRDLTLLVASHTEVRSAVSDNLLKSYQERDARRIAVEPMSPTSIGVEASLYLGQVDGYNACSASLHFLPLREGKLEIVNIYVYDSVEQTYFWLDQPYEVYAI